MLYLILFRHLRGNHDSIELPILVRNPRCVGTESFLVDCPSDPGEGFLQSSIAVNWYDVSVYCFTDDIQSQGSYSVLCQKQQTIIQVTRLVTLENCSMFVDYHKL